MVIQKLPLSSLHSNANEFYIIDIRGKQSFRAGHLRDSVHLQNKEEILAFIESNPQKELLLVCFSAIKARAMALALSNEAKFRSLYTHTNLYFLECGIMEAFDSGLESYSNYLNDIKSTSKNQINISHIIPPPLYRANRIKSAQKAQIYKIRSSPKLLPF